MLRAALVLTLFAVPAASAQDNACNAPAKDPIVHLEVPGSAFEPVISADGCWIFVTLTQGKGSNGGGVAKLDVGNAPISVTLSPDGRFLYTTSEAALPEGNWPRTCRPENPRANAPNHPQGAIIVFDLARALTDPSHSVISRAPANCNPVRLVLSPSGDVADVSARDDNALLAFDAQRLVGDTTHVLLGHAEVGIAPVGIAVIDSGTRVVVTSSNRFRGNANDHQLLTVVDVASLRDGRPAVVGTIQAVAFPRELRLTGDGRTLFVTNFASRTLEMIDLARAPIGK